MHLQDPASNNNSLPGYSLHVIDSWLTLRCAQIDGRDVSAAVGCSGVLARLQVAQQALHILTGTIKCKSQGVYCSLKLSCHLIWGIMWHAAAVFFLGQCYPWCCFSQPDDFVTPAMWIMNPLSFLSGLRSRRTLLKDAV